MLNGLLKSFFERDIYRLIDEINLFEDDNNLWRTHGTVKNSSGNLALHIIGGMKHLIGATLAQTRYVRDREQEFIRKGVEKSELVAELKELIPMIGGVLTTLDMDAEYPLPFDDGRRSNAYVLVQLSLHLNYHLGQVNYLRRVLE